MRLDELFFDSSLNDTDLTILRFAEISTALNGGGIMTANSGCPQSVKAVTAK